MSRKMGLNCVTWTTWDQLQQLLVSGDQASRLPIHRSLPGASLGELKRCNQIHAKSKSRHLSTRLAQGQASGSEASQQEGLCLWNG